MRNSKIKRFLACLLAVVLLSQTAAISPAVFADGADDGTGIAPKFKENVGTVDVIIESNTNTKDALAKALLENYSEFTADEIKALDWQYECTGYKALDFNKDEGKTDWGSVDGFTIAYKEKYIKVNYHFAALNKQAADSEFQVRLGDEVRTIRKIDRYPSSIVLNDNASITYNMDASAMEEAIIKSALNLEASELPEGVSVSDFTIEYETYGWVGGDTVNVKTQNPKWVPIEGEDIFLTHYPQMGAGEQKIKVTFNGNAEYKPSTAAEGTLTVNKADVKVTVKNKILHVKDELPEDFVTLNPNDSAIDVYTVYAGITSSVTTSVYVQLPARYQLDENVMKVVDYAVEKITGRSFSEILQEGITVGELKEFVNKLAENAEALEPILSAFNIDISSFNELVQVITKLPSIADNLRIAFGTPNHAGVYSVFAVTNNPNYNTAVGIGSVTLLMQTKDMKISLNENLARTITVSQAKALAESGAVATLNHSGSADGIDQTALHYLYSGVQKNLKPYSSTTSFPTEPGRYVVTVVVLGGDYLAAPVTYSFRIVND